MDKKKKTALALAIFATFWFVLGGVCGFFAAKGIYDQPIVESVSRDTTTTIDTIPDIAPEPKDSTPVRTVIRWLPMKLPKKSGADKESVDNPSPASTDTISRNWEIFPEFPLISANFSATDSVAVEIPITSKHYSSEEYDAWVSGYEASLDSIKVYSKERIVTETVTVTKKARTKRWGIGFTGGYGYDFNSKTAAPYVGVGVSYNIITF